jgi:hypothetical protein
VPDAAIRYFCLVLPNGGAQLGLEYLKALDATGLGVAAQPIGPAFLMAAGWIEVNHLFNYRPIAPRHVNVVVAPPNLLMGRRLNVTDVKAPGRLPAPGEETRPFALSAPQAPEGSDEPIYEPQTALGGLFTVGVPNVAITMPRPKPPEDHEVRALCQYDAVLAPTADDASALRHLGIIAFHVPADPAQLGKIMTWVLKTETVCEVVG